MGNHHQQEKSLDKWVDYLSSPDADYPTWAKYWAFTSVVKMGKFEKFEEDYEGGKKEFGRFTKREKDTVAAFPMLNPRALAMTFGVMREKLEQKQRPKNERVPVENRSVKLDDPAFQKLLSTENFSRIYAQFLIELPEYSTQGLEETRGEWVKYEQGTDPKALVDSLEGYPLEWCTANIDTARTQLQGGDFYVYYSVNEEGKPIIPRIAMRMQGDAIGEVRGIAPDQNLDPYISDVVKAKLKEFPDGAAYEKKTADMKTLTAIEQAIQKNAPLTSTQLRFLYEIDTRIEGFGYECDPRITELRSTRNREEDMPIVFECSPDQIAHDAEDITEDTKAYVGKLVPGIFQMLPEGIEHIYTSFPENRIRQDTVDIGGTSKEELLRQLEEKGIKISDYARDMLQSPDFATGKKPEAADLVRLTVESLGFPKGATTKEIFERAEELGLELCPAEVGPQYRLKNANQPMNEWFSIGMKQITDRYGDPDVFDLERDVDGLWLRRHWARPGHGWDPNDEFAFRLRKTKREA